MEIDHAARKARAVRYLAERVVTREPYIDEHGEQRLRWVETTHYDYKGDDHETHDTPDDAAQARHTPNP